MESVIFLYIGGTWCASKSMQLFDSMDFLFLLLLSVGTFCVTSAKSFHRQESGVLTSCNNVWGQGSRSWLAVHPGRLSGLKKRIKVWYMELMMTWQLLHLHLVCAVTVACLATVCSKPNTHLTCPTQIDVLIKIKVCQEKHTRYNHLHWSTPQIATWQLDNCFQAPRS